MFKILDKVVVTVRKDIDSGALFKANGIICSVLDIEYCKCGYPSLMVSAPFLVTGSKTYCEKCNYDFKGPYWNSRHFSLYVPDNEYNEACNEIMKILNN